MHRRNRYNIRPNYGELVQSYPALAPQGNLDFRDDEAVRVLNQALLTVDFDLDVCLPSGNLCPTIANRGTGASCIYPLLGCRLHRGWKFVATEIDPLSVEWATRNILANHLESRITLHAAASQKDLLLSCISTGAGQFDFCLCNPPFYSSAEDIGRKQASKATAASSHLTFTPSESIYPGGEVAFVARLVTESASHGKKCRWYTSLLGMKSSIVSLQVELNKTKAKQIKVLPLHVGRTKRWVLAWSFWEHGHEKKRSRPSQRTLELILSQPKDLDRIRAELQSLQIIKIANEQWQIDHIAWRRVARRQQSRGEPLARLDTRVLFCMKAVGKCLLFTTETASPCEWEQLVSLVNHLKRTLYNKSN